MDSLKNPQNIFIGAVSIGWAGSTIYFYKTLTQMKTDLQKFQDQLNLATASVNKHSRGFEEVKVILERNNSAMNTMNENLNDLADIVESQEEVHNYIQDCLQSIKKALTAKEITVEFPVPPRTEYQMISRQTKRRKNKVRKPRRTDDSDSEEDTKVKNNRQDRDKTDRQDRQDKPDRQDRDKQDRQDRHNRRRQQHDSDSDEDLPSQMKRFAGK
jgi:uncharacterized phage infection (PIP) family protein YhgE